MKRLRHYLYPFALFFACALSTTSCNNKVDESTRPLTAQRASKNAETYDKLGEEHNKGLDYFVQNADFKDYYGQIVPVLTKFGQEQGYSDEALNETFSSPQIEAILQKNDPWEVARDNMKQKGLEHELTYIDQLQKIFSQTDVTPEVIIEQLNSIEAKVKEDDGLKPEGQQALLRSTAVGKSSIKYWYAQDQLGDASPWVIKLQSRGKTQGKMQARLKLWQWIVVGGADAIGASFGSAAGVVGAVVCSGIAYGIFAGG